MTEKKKVTPAHMRATAKWEAENYDKSLIRFPKGTKDRIIATGESVNGFVNRLVKAELLRKDGVLAILAEAYTHIESPCHHCQYRTGHSCTLFGAELTEDSPDVFIPCQACEEIAAEQNF